MRMKVLAALGLVLFLAAGPASGQGSFTLDHVDGLLATDTVSTDVPITFYLRWNNNTGAKIVGCTNGFSVYSPDGATFSPITWVPYLDYSTFPPTVVVLYPGWNTTIFDYSVDMNPYGVNGIGADTIGFAGTKKNGTGVPNGFNEVVYSISTQVSDAQHGKTLCLDSTFYPPTNEWLWASDTLDPINPGTGDIYPAWGGPYCFKIRDPNYVPPAHLVISTDSLKFVGILGGANPAYQSFDVTSDSRPLNFAVSENTAWLQVSPQVGTTPKTINTMVNISGLAVGTYYANVTITSADAENSPQIVVVKLAVIPPPPEIGVSPLFLQFFGIVGGANPDPKTLIIKNVGASVLHWTVANSKSWLSLNPHSGTDSGGVTVSVDITGLIFGDYYDTIVVTDPNALNSPVPVPVKLTVGSNLPVIEVDSAFNYIIVPSGLTSIPRRKILVRNGGIGVMNFTLADSSTRIWSWTPTGGTAPQEVSVEFKINDGTSGHDYWDTLWVYSNEAVNSPFPVVFMFHYVDHPASLTVSKDTIKFSVYRCDQGANVGNPSATFTVGNTGGDNPMDVHLFCDTTLFSIMPPHGPAPIEFTLRAKDPVVDAGIYFDTILVGAVNAMNSPETLIVRTQVREGTLPPTIVVDSASMTFNLKEGASSPPPLNYHIFNRFAGCMEWQIQSSVPWLQFSATSGNVAGLTRITLNTGGYMFGRYVDTFRVVASSASNSPLKVPVKLNIWLFRGDCNFNGKVNVADASFLVNFLFCNGPAPMPELKIGDVNCNGKTNVADLTYLLSYLFARGPAPCTDW